MCKLIESTPRGGKGFSKRENGVRSVAVTKIVDDPALRIDPLALTSAVKFGGKYNLKTERNSEETWLADTKLRCFLLLGLAFVHKKCKNACVSECVVV